MTETAVIGDRQAARLAVKRHRARRGALIAAASTVIVLGGLAALILTSPGWPSVRETFFSTSVFSKYFSGILSAFWLDVKIFVVVEVVVLIVGLVLALVRTSRTPALFPLRILATGWVDVFRGIPVILLIYLIGFGIPALQQPGLPTDPILLGGIALAISYSAYVAEVYRAGIASVHRSQRDAALAIGLTEAQALRHVILPQAIRRVAPPLLNDFVALQKDAALVYILGVLEAFRVAQIDVGESFNYTPLVAVALIYVAITVPLARLVDRLGRAREAAP